MAETGRNRHHDCMIISGGSVLGAATTAEGGGEAAEDEECPGRSGTTRRGAVDRDLRIEDSTRRTTSA